MCIRYATITGWDMKRQTANSMCQSNAENLYKHIQHRISADKLRNQKVGSSVFIVLEFSPC